MNPAGQIQYSPEELEARKRVENSPLRFFISRINGSGDSLKLNMISQEQECNRLYKARREDE